MVAFSDDSLLLHDIRTQYQERTRLEIGGHESTVKTICFSKQGGVDFLCLTGGSDGKLKLWDLRLRKVINEYGDDDGLGYDCHDDSIWTIAPNENFDTCFTGGRDGAIC